MTKSMKFSAKFGKFMFYFGNIVIGIILYLLDLDDLGISEAGGKDFCRHGFPGYISAHSGISGQLCRGVFKAEHAQVFKNTLLYIGLILIFDLLVNSMCGYALAKFDFKGKGAIMNLVIALMVLPMEAIMLPLYIEMSQLGWSIHFRLLLCLYSKMLSIYMFRQFSVMCRTN